jgi:hypothetical protein
MVCTHRQLFASTTQKPDTDKAYGAYGNGWGNLNNYLDELGADGVTL